MALSPKDPEEIITVTFDTTVMTDSPSSVVMSAHVDAGNDDPNVSEMLVGNPVVSGSQIRQQVANGLNGTTYAIRCLFSTPDGNRFVITALLPVISI
jgi:hypothetical protein